MKLLNSTGKWRDYQKRILDDLKKQRIIDAFLNENEENIISLDIKTPKFITIIT